MGFPQCKISSKVQFPGKSEVLTVKILTETHFKQGNITLDLLSRKIVCRMNAFRRIDNRSFISCSRLFKANYPNFLSVLYKIPYQSPKRPQKQSE